MQNYPPQMQDLAVSPISHQLSISFEFRVFSRFTAFTADVLYENVSKTRKARMSRIRTRAQYCEYRFIHFRYRLIMGIMLCFNYKNGKSPF